MVVLGGSSRRHRAGGNARLRAAALTTVVCAGLLAACFCGEVLNEFYISDHTELDLTVRITPLRGYSLNISSGPLIKRIRKTARSSLQQPVKLEQDGDTTQFTLPPGTSVYLGASGGGRDLFLKLEVSSRDGRLVMDRDDYKDHFSLRDPLRGPIVHVLNVERLPPKPPVRILGDAFFYGCAYLDSNGNGAIDADDAPIEGAAFSVGLKGGAGVGGYTYDSGCATVVVPGGLDDTDWPVTMRMTLPDGADYGPVMPEETVLESRENKADFLFASP